MVFLYNLAYFFFGLFYLPIFIVKSSQAEDRKQLISDRLGYLKYDWHKKIGGKKVIWIHAVSVGEVMAVEGFIRDFLSSAAECCIVLTTVTPTGQKIAKQINADRLFVCYFPFDISVCVKRFFKFIAPSCLLLAETEIWPNVITEASRRKIPVGIINARLSKKSERNYLKFKSTLKSLFEKINFILAQTEDDAKRFQNIGIENKKVHVLGNMKYDLLNLLDNGVPAGDVESFQSKWQLDHSQVIVAGSTHAGEEVALARVFLDLKKRNLNLKMIIAPRHIERSLEILNALKKLGVRTSLSTEDPHESFDILILNQLGILKKIYALADVVYMGKSLIPKGGQNPVEAIAFKRAIVHGPYVFNFKETYDQLNRCKASLMVSDEEELRCAFEGLLSQESKRVDLGTRAFEVLCSLKGATQRHLEWLLNFLEIEPEYAKG